MQSRPIQSLLQTTIATTEDDWSLRRFSRLGELLREQRDVRGVPLYHVTLRDRDPCPRPDPVLSTLDESGFDQLWLFAVDAGDGLTRVTGEDCEAISRFRKRGPATTWTSDRPSARVGNRPGEASALRPRTPRVESCATSAAAGPLQAGDSRSLDSAERRGTGLEHTKIGGVVRDSMRGSRRLACLFAFASVGILVSFSASAQRAYPVSVQGTADVTVVNGPQEEIPVAVSREVPVAFSGDWNSAGLTFPSSMIVHDIIFYVADDNGNATCRFAMNFVINQSASRTLRSFTLVEGGSVELHYEAGIDAANLRFGTIGSACVRHWAAMGFAKP